MPDPICRWRYFFVENVKQLAELFPDQPCAPHTADTVIEGRFPGWSKTAYQLAAQVGLYCKHQNRFLHHRFIHLFSDNDWGNYMRAWLRGYTVPNPYTKGFSGVPVLVYRKLLEHLAANGWRSTWDDILASIWSGQDMGNKDAFYKAFVLYGSPLKFNRETYAPDAEVWLPVEKQSFVSAYFHATEDLALPKADDAIGFYNFHNLSMVRKWLQLDANASVSSLLPANMAAFCSGLTSASETAGILIPESDGGVKFLLIFLSSALLGRRFSLLSGLSGSGKTLLANLVASWLGEEQKDHFLIPVGANWTSKDDLLGYPDALRPGHFVKRPALELLIRAHENWKLTGGKEGVRPFFLILDEMNLSHVERYFSDFLSAMESDGEIELHDMSEPDKAPDEGENVWDGVPARIKIPGNLFVIGTVNVDETTYMFSPKVLDRANVIEFRTDKDAITKFLDGKKDVDLESIAGKGAHFGEAFVHAANLDTLLEAPYAGWLKSELDLLFEFLADHEGEFGFRTARVITRFVQFSVMLQGNPDDAGQQRELFIKAMDAQIMQKILPKMHGSKKKLGPVLRGLAELCTRDKADAQDGTGLDKARNAALNKPDEGSVLKEPLADLMQKCRSKTLSAGLRYPVSFEKIVRMLRMLDRDGFASFAEA